MARLGSLFRIPRPQLDRPALAACPCPCLTAALPIDNPAPWRGGVCRIEREEMWEHLESAFTNLRDCSFMHLDRLIDGRGTG